MVCSFFCLSLPLLWKEIRKLCMLMLDRNESERVSEWENESQNDRGVRGGIQFDNDGDDGHRGEGVGGGRGAISVGTYIIERHSVLSISILTFDLWPVNVRWLWPACARSVVVCVCLSCSIVCRCPLLWCVCVCCRFLPLWILLNCRAFVTIFILSNNSMNLLKCATQWPCHNANSVTVYVCVCCLSLLSIVFPHSLHCTFCSTSSNGDWTLSVLRKWIEITKRGNSMNLKSKYSLAQGSRRHRHRRSSLLKYKI